MLKSFALLVLGAVVGGALVFSAFEAAHEVEVPGADSSSLLEGIAGVVNLGGASQPAAVSVSETLEAYRAAASETDIASLGATLEQISAEPWSPARDVEIDALLVRLADLDPAFAAASARTLDLDTYLVADAYVYWARTDPSAAIGALAALGSRTERLEVALALLDVVGEDASGIERVALGLSESEAALLRVESIVSRADYEPFAAFRDALALRDADLQGRALSEIGAVWAAQDPRGAIAQAEQLPQALQTTFRSGAFTEWARIDGADFLDWIASASALPREAMIGVDLLAGSHLEQLIDIADAMSGDQGRSIRAAAYSALAEADPAMAMARAAARPPGQERDLLLMTVGSTVARGDPEAAFEWAREITPPSRNLMNQITISLVQSDPARAIELMDNPPNGVDPQLLASVLGTSIGRDPEAAELLANSLAASDSIQAANALARVVGSWIRQDPERAFEWVLANDATLDAAVIGPAAQAMARADPVAAAGYTHRIPEQYRSAWITQIAGPYGLRDPSGALAWVAQFQGQDFYDGALGQVISASAQADPRSAARMLAQSSGDVQLGAATQVAQALARQDPREAARWAATLREPRARRSAISATVLAWAAGDLGGARGFALGLERGETRDQALSALILSMGQTGRFDRDLLGSFSSDSAGQAALAGAIPMIARTDRAEAEDLLRLVTSANTRRQIEERIETLQ